MKKNIILITIITMFSCNNFNDLIDENLDLTPPFIEELLLTSSNILEIKSNEKITFMSDSFISRDNMSIKDIIYGETDLQLEFNSNFIPGKQYSSEFRIEDENGNSLSFIARYYGFNPDKPEVLINEFTVKGSTTNPNKIELYVTKSGNMAGLTLYNGTKTDNDYMFIFPSLDVKQGEYIVIRTITDNFPVPFTETTDLSVQHDSKFIDDVRDIRINNFKLSSTNGVISIYQDPFGEIIDAVIYSKNFNDDSKNNRNFGLNKMVTRVDEISEENHWIGLSEVLFPDDVIYIGDSTSTRSLNRTNFLDNNSDENWITVATWEESFGYFNSTVEY